MADLPKVTTNTAVTLPSGQDVVVTEHATTVNYKTLLWGAAMVVLPPLFNWASTVDWTQYVSATHAMMIAGVVTIMLRILGKGPVLTNLSIKKAN